MSTGTIVAIIVVILVVAALVVAVITQMRRRRLRERFGPEYDRVLDETDSRRQAEAELTQRERRVRDLDIRPLDPASRAKYVAQWARIQERFVDRPQEAVADAQLLVVSVMIERGYATEEENQVLADLSVEHAQTLDHYRAASAVSAQAASGAATTEDLRQAMIHYRVLFQDLLGESAADLETADPAGGTTVLDNREDIQQQTPRT
jgi:Tfp pilus assembly protein PilX